MGSVNSEVTYKECTVVKAQKEIVTKATVIVEVEYDTIVSMKLIAIKNGDMASVSAICNGIIVNNDKFDGKDICNICNVNENFETDLSATKHPEILQNIAILMATDIGIAMREGIDTNQVLLSSMFKNNYCIAKRKSLNEVIVKYGQESNKYAYMNKCQCIDELRGVYEYTATNCNGPLATELQLQLLYLPINKQNEKTEACLYLTLIDAETEGIELYTGTEYTVSEFNKMFGKFAAGFIMEPEVMEQLFEQCIRLIAKDMEAAVIVSMDQMLQTNKLKHLEQYFEEAVACVEKEIVAKRTMAS